ncbi:hypothetical protein DDV21_001035 [Streptococcus chenjunshii]|uniref:Uncharacterized protein n=1 Tax=Streptococcus chenjunshii TaxID=2173853 RepID=A0A372KKA9_9STRE|nr:hypothetical protein [Streptococcus chenjunshii]AXQ77755.1 hypothetical protein DDV21_001035 [Streptococcus chenjunshii]RFU50477.1 hypothetical protein DDV22_08370 [Streptococcus chenjunshii]RFU52705.1 hypothetical protein DDV23_08210 [Streptococcus chenjunshii]
MEEEKVFNKKFVYGILGALAVLGLVVYLLTINANGGGTGNSLDGEYYRYEAGQNVVITDNILIIDGKTALYKDAYWVDHGDENDGELYSVDIDKQTITKPKEGEYPYTFENGILTFGYYQDQYVKENSKEYREATKMTEMKFKYDW